MDKRININKCLCQEWGISSLKWIVYLIMLYKRVDRDSSVGIATRYELDGPGIEFRWGLDFPHPFRPALRPIQSPVQWVPGLSWG